MMKMVRNLQESPSSNVAALTESLKDLDLRGKTSEEIQKEINQRIELDAGLFSGNEMEELMPDTVIKKAENAVDAEIAQAVLQPVQLEQGREHAVRVPAQGRAGVLLPGRRQGVPERRRDRRAGHPRLHGGVLRGLPRVQAERPVPDRRIVRRHLHLPMIKKCLMKCKQTFRR